MPVQAVKMFQNHCLILWQVTDAIREDAQLLLCFDAIRRMILGSDHVK